MALKSLFARIEVLNLSHQGLKSVTKQHWLSHGLQPLWQVYICINYQNRQH